MSARYCAYAATDPVHACYHDREYGFPLRDEARLFERLALEIFQAGLSWDLILRKRASIVAAFDGFDVDRVAAYGRGDVRRLLGDAGIVRNRLKVESIIDNARRIQEMRVTDGSLARWLAAHHPLPLAEWVKLFRKTFRFTGGEICNEFLMSIGYLPGAHQQHCPIYRRVVRRNPPWIRVQKKSDRQEK